MHKQKIKELEDKKESHFQGDSVLSFKFLLVLIGCVIYYVYKESKIKALSKQIAQKETFMNVLVKDFGVNPEIFETEISLYEFFKAFIPAISEMKVQIDQRISKEERLDIDMNEEDDIKFVNLLKYFRLPKLDMINLENVDENYSDIVKLMTNSFPHQLS